MDNYKPLYNFAIFLYVMSLVIPVQGIWFGGVVLMFFTGAMSIVTLTDLNLESIEMLRKNLKFSVVLILPFANILFIWCILRFKKISSYKQVMPILVFIVSFVSVVMAISLLFSNLNDVYPFYVWALAFVFLSFAIVAKIYDA